MILMAGFEPDVEVPIVFTGLRPREKLVEELWSADEISLPIDHRSITQMLEACVELSDFDGRVEGLISAALEYDAGRVRQLLFELVGSGRSEVVVSVS